VIRSDMRRDSDWHVFTFLVCALSPLPAHIPGDEKGACIKMGKYGDHAILI